MFEGTDTAADGNKEEKDGRPAAENDDEDAVAVDTIGGRSSEAGDAICTGAGGDDDGNGDGVA